MSAMAMASSFPSLILLMLVICMGASCHAQLSSSFYDQTCPNALTTIRTAIRTAISKERRMAASLIRLHFHDCFVHGCDASILLKDGGEREAPPNLNSVRGYEVIDDAKSKVEKLCPGVVSCADIVAVAARDASFMVGGPSWTVKLGRRDSTSGFPDQAKTDLPSPVSTLQILIDKFANKGLSERDMVALSGSHTLGQARCVTFRDHIYGNATSIDAGFARKRQSKCPATAGSGDSNLAPLDLVTPNSFDNNYYKNLIQSKGLLTSDQVLFNGGSADSIVREYSSKPATFKADFAAAMIKMGDIEPLTGSQGQIRRICSVVN